ncbi:MAG: hypothetical protein IPK19_10680 [Chloroflexi bacterium]|nr:hypothetical protein [Chloroflexota bacterium]
MSQSDTIHSTSQQINAPFRAKSAGVSLVVVLIIGIYYLVNALPLFSMDEAVPDGALNLIITTVVLIVVVEVALQIVLFVGAGQIEKRTERDNAVAAKASRNAYLVLTAGTFAAFAGFTPFAMGSVLLLVFLLAEVVKFASQVVYYPRVK